MNLAAASICWAVTEQHLASVFEATNCVPVWQPVQQQAPSLQWGRFDRCVIASPHSLTNTERRRIAEAKSFCKHLLSCSAQDRASERKRLEGFSDQLPKEIFDELTRWNDIEPFTIEWLALQRLLRAAVSDESVTGMITAKILPTMKNLLSFSRPRSAKPRWSNSEIKEYWTALEVIKTEGMGDDIAVVVEAQMCTTNGIGVQLMKRMNSSTHSFISYLGTYTVA
jgi:hypothetical protein